MSDSESDLSTPANIPGDAEIEQCLRRVVRDALAAEEEITVNKARTDAEKRLGLDTGFLKDSGDWKKKSKDIINAAVDEPQSPEVPKKSAPKSRAKPAAKAGTKRKSDEVQPKKKRQKKSVTPESDAVVESEEEEAPKPKPQKRNARSKAAVSEGDAEPEAEEESKAEPEEKSEATSALSEPPEDVSVANGEPAEDDDSDMSSLIDDPPPKKKRQKKSTSPSESKPKGKATKPAKPAKELSPDDEETKRLQGWLVKCGIRKVWGVELKKCDTGKEKIRHLKKMLEEVGMTGRYSTEKAKQIKEQRELKAELEAAKEFNDKWGQKGSGEESGSEKEEGSRPRRLRPKGLVDFGDSGDEE